MLLVLDRVVWDVVMNNEVVCEFIISGKRYIKVDCCWVLNDDDYVNIFY